MSHRVAFWPPKRLGTMASGDRPRTASRTRVDGCCCRPATHGISKPLITEQDVDPDGHPALSKLGRVLATHAEERVDSDARERAQKRLSQDWVMRSQADLGTVGMQFMGEFQERQVGWFSPGPCDLRILDVGPLDESYGDARLGQDERV